MTTRVQETTPAARIEPGLRRKLCIIVSQGTLDMAYPPLMLANAARMSGIDVELLFMFWGLDIVTENKVDNLHIAAVGNPAMHIPASIGAFPGMEMMATSMMKKQIADQDFPDVREFIQVLQDSGAKLYACQASMNMMKLAAADLLPGVELLGMMEFLECSAGAQMLFV